MRIHTNLSYAEVETIFKEAEKSAGVTFKDVRTHGSRSHRHAFEIKLSGDSPYRRNSGYYGADDYQGASWDQWGIFLAELFDADPTIKAGPYLGNVDFHFQTRGRFTEIVSTDHPDYKSTPHRFQRMDGGVRCVGHGPKTNRKECTVWPW